VTPDCVHTFQGSLRISDPLGVWLKDSGMQLLSRNAPPSRGHPWANTLGWQRRRAQHASDLPGIEPGLASGSRGHREGPGQEHLTEAVWDIALHPVSEAEDQHAARFILPLRCQWVAWGERGAPLVLPQCYTNHLLSRHMLIIKMLGGWCRSDAACL